MKRVCLTLVFLLSFLSGVAIANDSTITRLKLSGFAQSRVINQDGETQFPAHARLFLIPVNVINGCGVRLTGESSFDFKYNKGQAFFAGLNSLYLTIGLESQPNIYLLLGRRLNPKDFYLPPPNQFWFVGYPQASGFGPGYANALLLQKDGGVISGMIGISDNGAGPESEEGYRGSDLVWRNDITPFKDLSVGFSGRIGKQANGRRDILAGDVTWQNQSVLFKGGFSHMENGERTAQGWWLIGIYDLPANLQLLALAESLKRRVDNETTYGFGGGLRLTIDGNSLVQINIQKSAGKNMEGKQPLNTALTLQVAF